MKHEEVCKQLKTIYEKKNSDYGNSFGESVKEWGIIAAIVRMDDKMRRLKSLVQQPALIKSESMKDTLMDLANYCIMSVMEVEK
jgi:tRNA G37 N-methylase TrmD